MGLTVKCMCVMYSLLLNNLKLQMHKVCMLVLNVHFNMGVDNWKNKLVGFGSDGASVNMAAGGLRGYLEADIPWVVVFWCLAHRLELSLKDALKHTLFSKVDEMLMRMYYLYEKSPKKC